MLAISQSCWNFVGQVPQRSIARQYGLCSSHHHLISGGFGFSLQCAAEVGPNGLPMVLSLVGITLEFTCESERIPIPEEDLLYAGVVINVLHSKLPLLPHLRAVELRADLPILQRAAKIPPEVNKLLEPGGPLSYRWGCPRKDFKHINTAGRTTIGVDPITLEPTGTPLV